MRIKDQERMGIYREISIAYSQTKKRFHEEQSRKMKQFEQQVLVLQQDSAKKNQRLEELEQQVMLEREILTDKVTGIYYMSLLSQAEALYIASQSIASDKIQMNEGLTTYNNIAKQISSVVKLFPVVGSVVSDTMEYLGSVADACNKEQYRVDILRLRSIAPTIVDFNAEVRKRAIDFAILNRTVLATLVSQAEKASSRAGQDSSALLHQQDYQNRCQPNWYC